MNEFKDQVDEKDIKEHGLIFLIDNNEDKMITENIVEINGLFKNDLHKTLKKKDKTFGANIHIETLGRIIAIK